MHNSPWPDTHFVPGIGSRCLGRTSSGVEISDNRDHDPSVFAAVTAQAATGDLPPIGRGIVPCIEYPDHRVIGSMQSDTYIQCQAVPSVSAYPPTHKIVRKDGRSNLSRAAHAKLLDSYTRSLWEGRHPFRKADTSNSFVRLKQVDFFRTVNTSYSPDDAKAPNPIHWDEPRPYTARS